MKHSLSFLCRQGCATKHSFNIEIAFMEKCRGEFMELSFFLSRYNNRIKVSFDVGPTELP